MIAELSRHLTRITKTANVALIEAIRPLLSLEVIDRETARKVARRLVEFEGGPSVSDAQRILRHVFERTDDFNRRDVARSIGIEVPEFEDDELGGKWRREHVAKITNIPQESRERIAGYLQEVGERGMRVETLRKRLQEVEGMSYRRARLVARDSVLTLNAQLTKQRHLAAGIEEYEWLTTGRGTNVRPHHAALHGKRFRYDDPPIGGGTGPKDRGHPGEGIGCKCQQIPVIPEFEELSPQEAHGPLEAPRTPPERAEEAPPPKWRDPDEPPPRRPGGGPQPLSWHRLPNGNYRSGDGLVELVRPRPRGPWELRTEGQVINLGRRATFDHAERALAQIRGRKR